MSKARNVYFIEAGAGGPIKIGVAADVTSRLRDLQCANASKLALLVSASGDMKIEQLLHRRFRSERLNGEWFKGSGPVREFTLSLVGMTDEERSVAVAFDPCPPREKRVKQKRSRLADLPVRTRDELNAMLAVGDSGSIYRTEEAELYFAKYVDTESIRVRQIRDERLSGSGDEPTTEEIAAAERVVAKVRARKRAA